MFRIFRFRRVIRRRRKSKSSAKSKIKYAQYKELAKILAERKVAEFNLLYNFPVNKITIRNQKTRWGSCSRKGNLSFSYKIVLLPEKLVDYIIVHEICHIGEFNHGQGFWNLVAKTIPNYLECRKELHKVGALLQ